MPARGCYSVPDDDLAREAEVLRTQAARDAMALEDLYAIDREFYASHICYFAEQTAEKSVKAALAERGIQYPVKHDIGLLLGICKHEGLFEASMEVFRAAGRLSRYEANARYEGSLDVTTADADLCVNYCNLIADELEAHGIKSVHLDVSQPGRAAMGQPSTEAAASADEP